MIFVTSVDGINTLVVDVIGQRSRDVIGRLSVTLTQAGSYCFKNSWPLCCSSVVDVVLSRL